MSGKWHLGINGDAHQQQQQQQQEVGAAPQDRRFTPVAHGYESYVGAPWTNAPMCAMDSDGVSAKVRTGPAFCFLMANDTVVQQPLRLENFTATITAHALSFLARQAADRPATPWFFLMAYFHVHTPLFTSRANRGRSKGGGAFGDNVEELDDSVGAIMAAVEGHGYANDTLIFLTSDNGPYQEEGWAHSGRTNVYDPESGKRLGRLKGGKGQLFEGGVRMPGAVAWPGVVRAGSSSSTLVSTMDLFPTILAAAGVPVPPTATARSTGARLLLNGDASGGTGPQQLLPYAIDGQDMGPVLRGQTTASQHEVFLHYCGFEIVAARVLGRWKVWWTMQNWYTNEPRNASICLECCNGVNPYSRVTGAVATDLCGCSDAPGSHDFRRLAQPVVFDVQQHDMMELWPITSQAGWPTDPAAAAVSFSAVVGMATAAREAMERAVHPTPSKAGAGTCTGSFLPNALPYPALPYALPCLT